ncbi:MAG: hypothetical protein ACLFSL_03625 [Candidatus Woesearchaeota archaeon]
MPQRLLIFFMIMILIFSLEGLGSEDCSDDEESISTPQFDMVTPKNGSWEFQTLENNTACCPSEGDYCVFEGRCYEIGDIIEENPRYACGSGNHLIEALGRGYEDDEEFLSMSVEDTLYAYTTQEGPPYAKIISCNSKDPLIPHRWEEIEDCSSGQLSIVLRDGPSKNTLEKDAEFKLELYKTGRLDVEEYERFTENITIERKDDEFILTDLLGSYYNIIVQVEGGSMGSISSARVNYDESSPETMIIDTYRDNTCEDCIDYSLGTGLCNRECEGRGLNNVCSFVSGEVREKCHMRTPGTEVVLDDGTRVECCNEILGPSLPKIKADVGCNMDNLVKKEYSLEWKGKPLKLVVSVCGEG